ncbi:MAG: hypothetical protein IKU03_03280 [Bacteroidales bacterium]|nr:hypothetical protein [Bacteroidales bacterium]
MKKIILTLTMIVCGAFILSAQSTSTDVEKKIQDRISYMKEHLKLNQTEAKSFWAEYDKYLHSEMTYHETFKKNLESKKIKYDPRNKESIELLSSDQIAYMMDQKMELKRNLNTLDANFYKKIKAILSPRHLFDFYTFDEQYKRNAVAQKTKSAATTQPASKDVNTATQSKGKR